MGKIIFLDIDGTLTVAGSNVPPESALIAIRKARENGHKVFLCTGRNLSMASPLLKYGFNGAVCSAGGYVFAEDKVLFDCPMEEEDFKRAMKLLGDEGVYRTIEARDKTYGDTDLGSFLANAGEGNSELVRWRRALAEHLDIRPLEEYDGRRIYKIVFMCFKAQQLEPAKKEMERDFNFVVQDIASRGILNGELINRKYDKGRGVRTVCDYYSVPLKDSIGFGDSMNDLEMIETVGISVCMDNGSPLLKEKSMMVCPAVEEDGLFKAFEELGLI